MWHLKNQPIRKKIGIVIMVTCSIALLLMAVALLAFQLITFRQNFLRDVSAIGEMIAHHSAGAISFKDQGMANEMLSSLGVKPHIRYAEIRTPDGNSFATYGKKDASVTFSAEPTSFQGRYFIRSQKIVLDREEIGFLYLVSDYGMEIRRLLIVYLSTLAVVLGVSIGVALAISTKLQRVLSDPILNLAKTARAIAQDRDYSVRAKKLENDEIGLFTDAFNQMLSRIEAQDQELRLSQQKVQSLLNSIEGIVLELDPAELHVKFVSQQAERITGIPTQDWHTENFFINRISSIDRKPVMDGYRQASQNLKPFASEFRFSGKQDTEIWLRSSTSIIAEGGGKTAFRTVLLDITERKRAEKELEELHRRLVDTSRQAGMAEVATGVLHNVGNVLNSVNVSATLVAEQLRKSQSPVLRKISQLVQAERSNLPRFFTEDPRGIVLPKFLVDIADKMESQETEVHSEVKQLVKNVEHIKDIVAMQQSYAKLAGLVECLPVEPMVEDALRMSYGKLNNHGVEIVRDFDPVGNVNVDKHKVLQILVNLLGNAKHAVVEANPPRKIISLAIRKEGSTVAIKVTDNGVGIPPENLFKVFGLGFTTKKNGHGFGLHSGANAAKEMGGSLRAYSQGRGHGSTFVLELPLGEQPLSPDLKS